MWKIIWLSIIQCFFISGGQICFKLAINRVTKLSFTLTCFQELVTNWWLLVSGTCMIAATFLWLYIIRHFDFSIVCTTISISYVFGMLAAVYIFHEAVPVTRWVGAFLIICGIILVVK